MKKIAIRLLFLCVCCFLMGGVMACSSPAKPEIKANVISSELLDGRVANFLGASGVGLLDKGTSQRSAGGNGISTFGATRYDEQQSNEYVQRKVEIIKETKDGKVDVRFYDGDKYYTYKDINNKIGKHHHNGVECANNDCGEISDEIAELEKRIEQGEDLLEEEEIVTIISLESRVNKLYNHGDYTFMSVSSAVEGPLTICQHLQSAPITIEIEGEQVLLNAGTGGNAGRNGVTYIYIPAMNGVKASVITIKKFEDDVDFNKTNYWCNSYNQSYVIDNRTGKTYSLERFPYIYSVENGIIKVYNSEANGFFDYYNINIENDELKYSKIELPTKEQANIPYAAFSRTLIMDKYGNILIEQKDVCVDDPTYDENGEKKFGEKTIVSAKLQSISFKIHAQQSTLSGEYAKRYRLSSCYHYGDDGRIYRLNFKGNLSEISVNVLDENCTWQKVDDSVNVTFSEAEGLILWRYSINQNVSDFFMITCISNGYAYYSTASATDGGRIWETHKMDDKYFSGGDYVGVVKIPVDGPVKSNSAIYEHLEFNNSLIINHAMNFMNAEMNFFLVGKTQMLFLRGEQSKTTVCLMDVNTGQIKELGKGTFADFTRESILIQGYGWISLKNEIDFENFSAQSFSEQPLPDGGGLDAYFKFVSDQFENPKAS